MIDVRELDQESGELLAGREALSRFSFNLHKTVTVTKHVATVYAENNSTALNDHSCDSIAGSDAQQQIYISQ
jgi:hypothetical protein